MFAGTSQNNVRYRNGRFFYLISIINLIQYFYSKIIGYLKKMLSLAVCNLRENVKNLKFLILF